MGASGRMVWSALMSEMLGLYHTTLPASAQVLVFLYWLVCLLHRALSAALSYISFVVYTVYGERYL